jgi:hypothetical protein
MGRKFSLSKLESCLSLLTDCYISSVIGCNWCPAPGYDGRYGKADKSGAQSAFSWFGSLIKFSCCSGSEFVSNNFFYNPQLDSLKSIQEVTTNSDPSLRCTALSFLRYPLFATPGRNHSMGLLPLRENDVPLQLRCATKNPREEKSQCKLI